MKNHLSNFELFISNLLDNNPKENTLETKLIFQQIDDQKTIQLESMDDLLFGQWDDQFINRLFRIYRIRLINISNDIYDQIRSIMWQEQMRPRQAPLFEIKLHLIMMIEELLQSADRYVPADLDLIAPNYNVDLTGNHEQERFRQCTRRLRRHKVSPTILNILEDYFFEIDSSKGEKLTYKQLEYCHKIGRGIQKMIDRNPVASWPDKIWQTLIHLDFNRERMQQYSKQHMYTRAIEDLPNNVSRRELLFLLKEVSSIDVDNNWSYEAGHCSIKDYTIHVIKDEIDALEKSTLELEKDIARQDLNYFLMNITERQLSFLAFINLKLKVIPYHSHRHVLRVLATFIRPLHGVPMSFTSASKKSIGSDKPTVNGLYLYLVSLVEYIKLNYGQLLN